MTDKIVELVTLAKWGIESRRWTNQTEMASHLGTVPDVLSRVLRELTMAEPIETDSSIFASVTIRDCKASHDSRNLMFGLKKPTKVGKRSGEFE